MFFATGGPLDLTGISKQKTHRLPPHLDKLIDGQRPTIDDKCPLVQVPLPSQGGSSQQRPRAVATFRQLFLTI